VIKQKVNKFSRSFFVSRSVYKRAVPFGFISLKKMEVEAALFLVAFPLPKKSAASASLLSISSHMNIE